jgi:hypothetical protein
MSRLTFLGKHSAGFSLLELVVALLLFQVGLLAVAGMILVAQASLRRSDGVLRGTLELVSVGDSLQRVGTGEGGEVVRPWGRIEWVPDPSGAGSLDLWALDASETDTLAYLRLSAPSSPGGESPSHPHAAGGKASRPAAEGWT